MRPDRWHRGMPQTQTAYVAIAFAALIVVIWILAPVQLLHGLSFGAFYLAAEFPNIADHLKAEH